MITLIAAINKDIKTGKLGIGKDCSIPWYLPEDLQFFKQQTYGGIVVMGRKTYESMNYKLLPGRDNIILSQTLYEKNKNIMLEVDNLLFNRNNGELIIIPQYEDFQLLVNKIKTISEQRKKEIFIIGGQEVYTRFLQFADRIILTEIYGKYDCDVYFPPIPYNFEITNYSEKKRSKNEISYRHIYFKNKSIEKNAEMNYKDLVLKILNYGNHRSDRTGTGTISLFGEQLRFDISKSIPLLTSKRVPWKTCIKELLWMLRGETDAKILQKQGVHIWDGNSSREFLDNRGLHHYPEGELGPVYGWQIRRSGAKYPNKEDGFDQLLYIENLLKTDPFSRRILWNLWNPSDLDKMSLVPCHFCFHLYCEEINGVKYLSGMLTQRSSDIMIGNPLNYLFYTILIYILALRCDMKPKELIHSSGDVHVYKNIINETYEYLSRQNRSLPVLELNPEIKNKTWEEIIVEDFDIIGYFPDSTIKMQMAV